MDRKRTLRRALNLKFKGARPTRREFCAPKMSMY
jgi:hypothetical protein